jgi:hypothetical protein
VTKILSMTLLGTEPTRCPTCGDVVGVYEPSVIAFPDGRTLHASMAAVGSDLELGSVIRHRDCHLDRLSASDRAA